MPGIFEQMQADAAATPASGATLLEQMREDAKAAAAANEPATPPIPRPRWPTYLSTFGNAIPKGMAGFADMIPNTLTNLANLGIAGYGVGKHVLTGSNDLPDLLPADSLSGFHKMATMAGLIDPNLEPTDRAGRMIDFGGQVLGGGGINPVSMGRALARGAPAPILRDLAAAGGTTLGGGAGAELTRDIDTGSESMDNLVKALATLGGGMAGGGALSMRGTAEDRVAAATSGVTPQQWAAAIERSRVAAERGSPVTGYEALQAETGLNPKMQTQQRVAEQSDAANNGLTQMMQARPAANEAMMGRVTGGISPVDPFPDVLAGRLQNAATGAIDAARNEGNVRAAPYYARSSNDPNVRIPPQDWNAIASDPAIGWALEQVRRDPLLGMQGATEGSVQWLDAAKKFLDSRGQSLQQAGDRYPAQQAAGAATRITGAVDPVVPDYARARAIVAQNMQDNVVPMEASQVGKLSRSDAFPAQAEALLPNKPMDVTPQVVERTTNTINAQDPNIMRQFVAQYLRGQFNEANQQNMGGPNVFGGSKFAAQVAGNPAQEANLVQALTSAGANPAQMMEALQIFRAQGMKPPVNSATTTNAAEGAALGGGVGNFIKNPISNTMGLIDKYRNGGAAQQLARALSSGASSVDDLAALARANGTYNPLQQQVLANLLMANRVKPEDAYEQYIRAFEAAPDQATKAALGRAYAESLGQPTR